MENKSLKKMQKVLINRLDHQFEEYNHILNEKQFEVNTLMKRLELSLNDNRMLHQELDQYKNEVRKYQKLFGYYPTQKSVNNGRQSLQQKLGEQLYNQSAELSQI